MNTVSPKQLEANKKNALKGGVKTPEGKHLCRYNALKHGLLCKDILIIIDDPSEYKNLAKELMENFKPDNAMERILVEKIIVDLWRLRRALVIEKELMENELVEADEDGKIGRKDFSDSIGYDLRHSDNFGKYTRYLTSIERSLYRALHELQRLQAQRMGQKVLPPMVLDVDVSSKD